MTGTEDVLSPSLLHVTSSLYLELTNIQYLTTVQSNYGDLRFQPESIAQARQDQYFGVCDNFIRNGEYKHFISQTQ